jgi:L-threonylcarbamoyladenylate synthase
VSTIEAAADALAKGGLVVVPTDTVYGVAAALDDPGAIAALFTAKGRPSDKPLPVLGEGVAALETVVTFDPRARAVAERFWPGAVTLVLPRAAHFDVDLGRGGESSVAVRVPRNDIILELVRRSGPLAVSSANRSDEQAAVTVQQARKALGEMVQVFLDGGRLLGRPSTIVSMIDQPTLIRAGEVSFAEIQTVMS